MNRPRNGILLAKYMMPYAKAILDVRQTSNPDEAILDISEVAYKFLSSLKDAKLMLKLMIDEGYRFVPLGDFKYRFIGKVNQYIEPRDIDAMEIKKSMRDRYLEDINRVISHIHDDQLLVEMETIRRILIKNKRSLRTVYSIANNTGSPKSVNNSSTSNGS